MIPGSEAGRPVTVWLILDDSPSMKPGPFQRNDPIWIGLTPNGPLLAKELRSHGYSVTELALIPGETDASLILRAIGDIEDHHGAAAGADYRYIIITGKMAFPEILPRLRDEWGLAMAAADASGVTLMKIK